MSKRQRRDKQSTESQGTQGTGLDPVFGQYRALPVSQEVLNNISQDTVPQDAETYLALVRKQAESSSAIMFHNKVIHQPLQRHNEYNKHGKQDKRQDKNTQKYTQSVIQIYNLQREQLPPIGQLPIPNDFIFPENFTQWRSFILTHQPSTSLISNLDHQLVLKLIIYSTQWMNNSITPLISQWIWGLFLRINHVLNSNEMAIIRELGQKAIKIRQNIKQKELVDFIIVLVSTVFGQKDLQL